MYCFHATCQMLMSVLLKLIDALKYAEILLDHTTVPAEAVIVFTQMDTHAMVTDIIILTSAH